MDFKSKNPIYPPLKLPGLPPINVASKEQMQKHADEEGVMVMCIRVKDAAIVTPESTVEVCSVCEHDVWISPATKEAKPHNASIICPQCVGKLK